MTIWLIVILLPLLCVLPGTDAQSEVQLAGEGGTFPANVYQTWTYIYPVANVGRLKDESLNLTYNPQGSGAGKKAILSEIVTYGASDSNVTAADRGNRTDLLMIPVLAGSVAIIYQHPLLKATLTLTRDTVVGIFNGTITTWDHPLLTATNPALATLYASSPGPKISLVVRSDSSGTTEITTSALSAFSPAWNAKYGIFSSPTGWPSLNQSKQNGNPGVCLQTVKTDYSFAYTEVGYANLYGAAMANLINQQGVSLSPTNISALNSALNDFVNVYNTIPTSNFFVRIVDGNGAGSYPIVGYTYLLLLTNYPSDCVTAYELIRYVYWVLTDSQASSIANSLTFVTVSQSLYPYLVPILNEFYCGGVQLLPKVLQDLQNEAEGGFIPILQKGLAVVGAVLVLGIIVATAQAISSWRKSKTRATAMSKISSRTVRLNLMQVFRTIYDREKKLTMVARFLRLAPRVVKEVLITILIWLAVSEFTQMGDAQISFCFFASVHTSVLLTMFGLKLATHVGCIQMVRKSRTDKEISDDVKLVEKSLGVIRENMLQELCSFACLILAELPLGVTLLVIMYRTIFLSMLSVVSFGAIFASAGFRIKEGGNVWQLRDLYKKGVQLIEDLASSQLSASDSQVAGGKGSQGKD